MAFSPVSSTVMKAQPVGSSVINCADIDAVLFKILEAGHTKGIVADRTGHGHRTGPPRLTRAAATA